MKPELNSSMFNWIADGRSPFPEPFTASAGIGLSSLFPLVFPRYAKILHALDAHYENIDNPLSPEEISILQIPSCDNVRDLVVRKRSSSSNSRILWKDVALALDAPYAPGLTHEWFSARLRPNPQCWSRFIYGPADGSLDATECRELASLLLAATSTKECHFRLAEIPFVGTDQNLLFTGMLSEVEDFFVGGKFQSTPEYWWPNDRSWCVCSDYDLTFTIVGGDSSLIDSMLSSPVLECIEVGPDIRIDHLTPMKR